MIRLCAMIALGLAGLPVTAASPPPLNDLTGDYVRFYNATKNVPPAQRVACFKAEMATRFPGFYRADRVGIPEAQYDGLVAASFENFPRIEADFVARAAAVAGQLAAAQADFAEAFPAPSAMPPVYLIHSLGEMDGGTRELNGKTVLVFGADVIARAHAADANERPFFEHELFHVYHEPSFKPCDTVWCALFEEGLATHVAATLNPGAKAAELLLDDATLAAIKANPAPAACAIRRVASSAAPDDYQNLFNGGASFPGLPERAGYYIGFLIAQQLGKDRSIQQLAALSVPAAKAEVFAALDKFAADCPA